MTPEEYREVRRALGTQAQVAEWLDVSRRMIVRRERGETPITREAVFALKWIYEKSYEMGKVGL